MNIATFKDNVIFQAFILGTAWDTYQGVQRLDMSASASFVNSFTSKFAFLKTAVSGQSDIRSKMLSIRLAFGNIAAFAVIIYFIKNRKLLKISNFWLIVIIIYFASDILSQ